jgi:sugar lactone lactonase YvrE
VAAGPSAPDDRGGDRSGGFRVFEGTVRVDGAVVQGTTVRLLAAGTTPGSARVLRTTTSDKDGRFVLRVPSKVDRDDVLYVTSRGGSTGDSALSRRVELAASLADRRSGPIVVNERTTVAAAYSLAQFAEAGSLGGASPGLPNAARMAWNLVDVRTGAATRFLRTHPNGTATQTFASFNSLASIIAGCAARTNDCGDFLDAATDAWGVRPATTWQAMTLIPTNPSGDPTGVFDQIPRDPRFRPVLTAPPAAWVVALRFYGNGRQFNGPGNVAFDARGRVWANNNAEWARLPRNVCPGLELYRLNPYAPGRPMQTFTGGGLNGAGFGIGIDPKQRVWIGNFGFTGSKCPTPPTSNSVSEFEPSGQPITGDRGYRNGPLSWPQGTKSDVDGNIWIANCGNNSLVKYPNGQHRQSQVISRRIGEAFDVAQNTEGNIFVTANEGDEVFGFRPNGQPLPGSPFGDSTTFAKPLGAASDSLGNVWVSNSGVIAIPCSTAEGLEVPDPDIELDGSVVQVGPDGSLAQFDGAGLTIPWGIAVDGDDNLWVANFSGERLSHLCGARASTCPAGQTGAPISPPDTGYAFDGLQRNTGVQVDSSGNVWLTNNWIKIPVQTDPFGDGLVVYLGMAAPVKTPLIGTPQQP